MSFFGVQLNAQVNRLVLNIKLTLAKNKYLPNFRTIYRSFVNYDHEQSGLVSPNHFEKALNQNSIFFKKFQIQVFEKAFGQNGKINWFSLMGLLRQPMNKQRGDAIQKIFDHLDPENNGKIHYSHLINLFNPKEVNQYKLGLKSKQKIGEQFLSMVPLTPEGFITREQFFNFYNDLSLNIPSDDIFIKFSCSHWDAPYNPQPKVRQEQVRSAIKLIRFKLIQKVEGTHEQFLLKKVFDQYDINRNGVLCDQQLQSMLVKLQVPVQSKFVKALLQKMDHNKNGKISYDQFKNFLFFDPYPN